MSDRNDPDREAGDGAGDRSGEESPTGDDPDVRAGEGAAGTEPDPGPAGASEGEGEIDERVERVERREQRLEEREQRLDERERQLDERERQLEERASALGNREDELDERAARLDERESAVEERIEEFEAAREEERERLDRALESTGTGTNRTPAAGGILLMFVGIITAVVGVGLLAAVATNVTPLSINFDFGAMAAVGLLGSGLLGELTGSGATVILDSVSVILGLGAAALVLALLVIAGGWQAFQRKHWFFSLVTGIVALLLVFPLGLLAIFLITVGERQFGAQ